MTTVIKMILECPESAIMLWSIGEIGDLPDRVPESVSDPLAVLLATGHNRTEIVAACSSIEQMVLEGYIVEPLSIVQRDILRVAVENSSWLEPYRRFGGGSPDQYAEKAALRRLATRLQIFDIDVNYIPS